MKEKRMSWRVRLLALAIFAFSLGAKAAPVDEEAARAAAEAFLSGATGRAVLPGRAVGGLTARGSLWIAALLPTGHLVVSGSDATEPILLFSANDFAEPPAGSPMRAALEATAANVAAAEARGSRPAARAASSRRLLAASSGKALEDVEELMATRYDQWQPQNDFAPVVATTSPEGAYRARNPAGCVAVANTQIYRTLRWPARIDRTRTVNHNFKGETFTVRIDGHTPIDWDALLTGRWSAANSGSYPVWNYGANGRDLRGYLKEDERYAIGRAIAWEAGNAGMSYSGGEGTSTPQTANNNVLDWFTKGRDLHPTNDAENVIWKGLHAGIPQLVSIGGHAVVADGWRTDEAGEVTIHLNYGWSGDWNQWASAKSGPIKYIVAREWPRGRALLDPIPEVCGADVTLSWQVADVWTNAVTGFTLDVYKSGTTLEDVTPKFAGGMALAAVTEEVQPLDGIWRVAESSVLTYELLAQGDNSGVQLQARFGNGGWEDLDSYLLPYTPDEMAAYTRTVSLAAHRNETMQLRIKKWGRGYSRYVYANDFKLTNVFAFDTATAARTMTLDGASRTATVMGLEAGADYAFVVTPTLAESCLVAAEPSDPRFCAIAGTRTVPNSTTTYAFDGADPSGAWETSDATGTYPLYTTNIVAVFSGSALLTEESVVTYTLAPNPAQDPPADAFTLKFASEDGSILATIDSDNIFAPVAGLPLSPVSKAFRLDAYAGIPGTLTLTHECNTEAAAANPALVYDISITRVGSTEAGTHTEEVVALGTPSIESVTVTEDGATNDLIDGAAVDGAIGTKTLNVTCSVSVTRLRAFPSHLTLVKDENVHVTALGEGRFAVTFDPVIPAKWNRSRMILTLAASDANGTTAYRDIVMRMTTDEGTEDESGNDIKVPVGRPLAVWNGDFKAGDVRGGVTFDLNGQTLAGGAVTFADGGVRFVASEAFDTTSCMALMGLSDVEAADGGVFLAGLLSSGGAFGPGLRAGEDMSLSAFGVGGDDTEATSLVQTFAYPGGAGYGTFALRYDAGEASSTLRGCVYGGEAVSATLGERAADIGGWVVGGRPAGSGNAATGASLGHIALFASASANDLANWTLTDMTAALTLASGTLAPDATDAATGLNFDGGVVTVSAPVTNAALFVQGNTIVNFASPRASLEGGRVLYIADGKALQVNVTYSADALKAEIEAAGGNLKKRLIKGANYGDVTEGALPAAPEGYVVKIAQDKTGGVYLVAEPEGGKVVKPLAVWNRDFADGDVRGGVRFALSADDATTPNADTIANGVIRKTAVSAEDNGGKGNCLYLPDATGRLVAVAGVTATRNRLNLAEESVVGARNAAGGTALDVGLGFGEDGRIKSYKGGAATSQTTGSAVPEDRLAYFAMDWSEEAFYGYVDGTKRLTDSVAVTRPLDTVLLGGTPWARRCALAGGTIAFAAVFTDEDVTEADIQAWSLTGMTNAVTLTSGTLESKMTDAATGLNFHGGTVTIAEKVTAAALFVQGDTVLDFTSPAARIAGAKVIYVAEGASLKVRVSASATMLKTYAEIGGGALSYSLIEGARYGLVQVDELPEIDKYDVSLEQTGEGVTFSVVRNDPDWLSLVTNGGATLTANGGVPYKGTFTTPTYAFTATMDVTIPDTPSDTDRALFAYNAGSSTTIRIVVTSEGRLRAGYTSTLQGGAEWNTPASDFVLDSGNHRIGIRYYANISTSVMNRGLAVFVDGELALETLDDINLPASVGDFPVTEYCIGATLDGELPYDGLTVSALAILNGSTTGGCAARIDGRCGHGLYLFCGRRGESCPRWLYDWNRASQGNDDD